MMLRLHIVICHGNGSFVEGEDKVTYIAGPPIAFKSHQILKSDVSIYRIFSRQSATINCKQFLVI